MKDAPTRYWFPAKRHGWGWGLPSTWEGWLVFGGFLGAVLAGAVVLSLDPSFLVWYLAGTFTLTAVLLIVCWSKGEPPRWRWADDD